MLGEYAWFGSQVGSNTKPVGQKAPNSLGLFDIHGNVWEWRHDGFGPYNATHAIDPVGTNEVKLRVLRGGAFNTQASDVRSATRISNGRVLRSDDYGFRIVRTFEKFEPKKPETAGPAVPPNPDDGSALEKPKTTESVKKVDGK